MMPLDLVTIEDSLALQSSSHAEPDSRTDQVRGRLDAALIAARVAPLTEHIVRDAGAVGVGWSRPRW
jgi:hypothetical protein